MNKKKKFSYDNRVVTKPWGNEYVVYRNSKKLSVTLLNIDYNKKTSLHCHPTKKTGFIVLSGKALIQLGLWKATSKNYSSPSKLMIRTGLFHSIKAISKKGLCALEFETPVNKKDLVRFKDSYGREKKPYEGKELTVVLFDLKQGFKFEDKGHDNEQITWLIDGEMAFYANEEKKKLTSDVAVSIGPNHVHGGVSGGALGFDAFFPKRIEEKYKKDLNK